MTTSRLERAIARLHLMSHEEYANFLKKHTKSDNCDVSFAQSEYILNDKLRYHERSEYSSYTQFKIIIIRGVT